MPDLRASLVKTPSLFRSPIARGLAVGSELDLIDEKGGDSGAGIIRQCAVITVGEALGHDLWIDQEFLSQVSEAVNQVENGVKMRFTHPDLSGDGLGSYLGRAKNASLDGDVVRADSHLSKSSRKTPDGDLGGYVMQLAQDDPEAFGLSISFEHDYEAEVAFAMEHGAYIDAFDELDLSNYQSPDPNNTENYLHCRLKALKAVDAVDTPAANPNGLFHKGQEIPRAAEQLLSFSLGLTSERPKQSVFDIDPDRMTGFVQRFLSRNGLTLSKKEIAEMATKKTQLSDPPAVQDPVDPPVVEETVTEKQVADEEPGGETPIPVESTPQDPPKGETLSEGQKFLDAFGERGAVLFAQGKSFAEAQAIVLHETLSANAELQKRNAELQEQLKANRGETPVTFQTEPTAEQSKANRFSQNLGPNLGRFAAGLSVANRN